MPDHEENVINLDEESTQLKEETKELTKVQKINQQVALELSDEKTKKALLATTFNGLDELNMRKALLEGMIRGFAFDDFLKKNIYALPFKNNQTGKQEYSLIVSIDHLRQVGGEAGIIGKSKPEWEIEKDDKGKETIISCTITLKKLIQGHIGEFTATVFFDEFNTGKSIWRGKPKMMIAKVAEAHAYRMACPKETAQLYVAEEMEKQEPQHVTFVDRVTDSQSSNLSMGNYTQTNEKENHQEETEADSQDATESTQGT